MIIEQLLFTVIAFALFVYLFLKMIRNNDTSYIIVLIIQAIGIALNFLEVLFRIKLNILFMIIKYLCALLLPVTILLLEKRGIKLTEFLAITKAKIYLKLGNTKKAKQALLELTSKYPENYQAHKLLAQIYEKEGGMRRAIDEYVLAIDLNKQDYDSYYKIAELLEQLDKKEEAAEMLFNLLNKKPEYEKASTLLGEILIEQERYKEAANVYQEALRRNPISFELNYNLGIVYTMLNDFQSAKMCYEKAAQINSLVYNTKYSLAEIALIYKELQEAEKYFMETLEDEELAADSYYELAKIAMIKGEKDTAIQYANTAIDADAKKIVPKVKKDPIFIPILARIAIPFNVEQEEIEEKTSKMKPKEIKAKEHLEEMFDLTRHLSYQDIRLLNNNKNGGKGKKEEQQIEGKESRERQD